MNHFTKFLMSIVLVGLLAVSLAAFPGVVSAQGLSDPETPPGPTGEPVPPLQNDRPGWPHAALEKMFAREQEWLVGQKERLDKQDEVNARVNEMIAKAREHGLDPAPLEAALAQFNTSIENARQEHLKARAVLTIHAGFNDQGKVIQVQEAKETVRTAGEALRSARQIMVEAGKDLFRALREFRQNNLPVRPSPGI